MCLHKGLIFFFLLFASYVALGQENIVTVEGTVTSETGEQLKDINISVSRSNPLQLLVYRNTDNSSDFSIKVPCAKPDTFLINVSLSGFYTQTATIYAVPGKTYKFSFLLKVNYIELEKIILSPPPVWKKGDTTFFNIAAFKDGDERKLVDILSKLPGFHINESGDILYKGKKIEKIKIGGEELFADKPDLLARTFPIHVLKNIQTLENQNRNELLKGLVPDDEVILNLDLDKNAVLHLFGDAEAGLGTKNRYKFKPVAFSLKNKIKAGLISNNNNDGDNIKSWMRYKYLGTLFPEAVSKLISTGVTPFINDFNDSRYIHNTTFDNRVQVNIPLSKSLKTNTEFDLIHDKSTQSSYEDIYFYSDSVYKRKLSNNAGKSIYRFASVNEKIEWTISKKSSLKINAFLLYDNSSRNTNTNFLQGDTTYFLDNLIENKWRSWQADGDYTLRQSDRHALELTWQYSHLRLPQKVSGYSPSLYKDFPLPDSSYSMLFQPINNFFNAFNLKLSYFAKSAKRKAVYNLYYTQKQLYRNSLLQINDKFQASTPVYLNDLSGTGRYSIHELYTEYSNWFSIFNVPLIFIVDLGAIRLSSFNDMIEKTNTQPRISIGIDQKQAYSKISEGEFELKYKQVPPDIYNLSTEVFPNGFASFQSYRNIFLPSRYTEASYHISFSFKNYSILNSYLHYQRNFTSYIIQPTYDILSSTSIDSAVHQSSSTLFSLSTYSFPFLPLSIKVTLNNNISRYGYLSNIGQSLNKMAFISLTNSIELVRNWNKKTFFTLKYTNQLSRNSSSKQAQNPYLNKTINNNVLLSLKQNLGKTAYVILSSEWINNSSTGSKNASGIFMDLDFKKEFPKNRIWLAAKLENITNQSTYRIYNSYSPLYQSLLTIPLIRRNIMISASWSF